MENLAGPAAIPTSTATTPETADTTIPSPAAAEEKHSKKPPPNPQLETLCKTMYGKGLRTYIISQLPLPEQENTLREQLPEALKLAPNAAKLVLSCVGDFYAKRGKDLNKDTQMISYREASALVLECFLLMGLDEIDEAVSKEAEQAAVIWRRRLVDERGIKKASERDARGLLLLIGCFGIPQVFRNEDIRDLIRKSNIRGIKSALRRSNVLIQKIPEIIEGMVKHKMEVEAVDVAYTFGVEEKISPYTILSSFLHEFKESLKKRKWKSHGSHDVVNEANKRELSTMKSVIECLEAHNIDPSKLIPRFRISDRIESLEKKIARNDQRREKMVHNWKFDETGLSRRFDDRQAKRIRIPGSEQQRAVNHVCSQRPLLEGGTAGHFYDYSLSPPVLPGPVARSIADTVPGSVAASEGGVVMGGFGSGITRSTDNVLQAGSYAGFRGGMPVDSRARQARSYNNQLYGWQGGSSMHERSVSHNYRYGSPPPWQGSMGLPNSVSIGVGRHSSASDPYQLANIVPGSAPYRNSGSYAVGTVPSVNHRSSYLYPRTYYP
ncbi:PREDICTED: protein FRIGIDA-like [Nicotiana attenuata]|uniref:FRIGIDA-like protein n=1 Tax=Nicotiana attenuata TaxID=49451 RepID=A0A314KYT2_NICAT|nr:PREDICTED: protein FRIGIDA-like [Nicotiana attenuata]OIT34402.1 protein frigida [Nicotiana attenuata]